MAHDYPFVVNGWEAGHEPSAASVTVTVQLTPAPPPEMLQALGERMRLWQRLTAAGAFGVPSGAMTQEERDGADVGWEEVEPIGSTGLRCTGPGHVLLPNVAEGLCNMLWYLHAGDPRGEVLAADFTLADHQPCGLAADWESLDVLISPRLQGDYHWEYLRLTLRPQEPWHEEALGHVRRLIDLWQDGSFYGAFSGHAFDEAELRGPEGATYLVGFEWGDPEVTRDAARVEAWNYGPGLEGIHACCRLAAFAASTVTPFGRVGIEFDGDDVLPKDAGRPGLLATLARMLGLRGR